MRIVYIADDGTHFDDEYECRDYEWMQRHRALNDVVIFDKDGNWLKDIFSEDTYSKAMKIVVPNRAASLAFIDLAQYTGFCTYEDINRAGIWVWDEEQVCFVKK